MFLILLLLFTVLPALEFYLLFSIGAQIGAGNTFLIIILTGVVGAGLAKSQGLIVLHRIQAELANGGLPGRDIVHGLLLFGGGLLLLTPGFLTDAIGFSFVLPGTRHIICEALLVYFKKAVANGSVKFANFHFSQGAAGRTYSGPDTDPARPDVIETEFHRKD